MDVFVAFTDGRFPPLEYKMSQRHLLGMETAGKWSSANRIKYSIVIYKGRPLILRLIDTLAYLLTPVQ